MILNDLRSDVKELMRIEGMTQQEVADKLDQKGKDKMNKVSDHVLAYLAGTCANIDSVNGKYHVYDDEMDFGRKTLEQLERFCKKENKLAKEATGEQPYKLYKADDEDICYYFWNKGYPSFEESQTVASWIGVEHELYLVKEVK